MTEKEIIKDFVQSIVPAIEEIDGGCKYCIEDFCLYINDKIQKYDLELRSSIEYPIRVTLLDI